MYQRVNDINTEFTYNLSAAYSRKIFETELKINLIMR